MLQQKFATMVVACLCGMTAAAQTQPSITRPQGTIRLICLPGVPLPVVLGEKQGIFQQFGVTVVAEKATNATALRDALTTQKADLAYASVENALVGASGADEVIVMGGEMATSELIVQPSIHRVEDLRGHVIILDGEDTAYTLLLRRILERHGIRPGIDCTMRVIGLAPQRLAAMRDHPEYAATIQKAPTSLLSERAGLHSLGSTAQLSGLGRIQGIGGFVLRTWAHGNSDLLDRYIAAFIVAQRFMMDPANKPAVITAMRADSHMPEDIAEQTYEISLKTAWTADARFNVAGFRNVLALDAQQLPGGNAGSPKQFYDLSWYKRGVALASQSKCCSQ